MWYFYVLESKKDSSWYKGHTNDLQRRFAEHNDGRGGTYTKKFVPFMMIYIETYIEESDALKAERFYKTGYGREMLVKKLATYVKKSKSSKM